MAVPAIAIGIAGTADAADAPSTTVGAAAQAHLSTLVPAVTVDEHGVYLAPTENMLHDGYAEPHGQIDLQFSCRGYFLPPASWAAVAGRR